MVTVFNFISWPGSFAWKEIEIPSSGWTFSTRVLDEIFCPRNTRPAPIVDLESCRDKGFSRRILLDARLLPIAREQGRVSRHSSGAVLPADNLGFDALLGERPDRLQ